MTAMGIRRTRPDSASRRKELTKLQMGIGLVVGMVGAVVGTVLGLIALAIIIGLATGH